MTETQTTSATQKRANKSDRRDIRTSNRQLVLKNFLKGEKLSRAELSRRTNLNPTTVSALVAELQEMKLVQEAAPVPQTPRVGKPPTMMELRGDAYNIVAVDLSSPNTMTSAVVDLHGKPLFEAERAFAGATGEEALRTLDRLVKKTAKRAHRPILGVGISTPGLVTDDTTVVKSANLNWHQVDLRHRIQQLIDVPVYVTNDANSAAIAEFTNAKKAGGLAPQSLAVIKIGFGVGAGFVINGKPYAGVAGAAGEIGHLVVDRHGDECRCGLTGCLETFVAVPNVEAKLAAPGADRTAILDLAADRLGIAVAAMVAVLGIHEIVLAGPQEFFGPDFCDLVTESVRRRCLDTVATEVNVRYPLLPEDAAILGAASLVLSQELGVA